MSQANRPPDALQENQAAPSTNSLAGQTDNAGSSAIDLDLSGRQLGDYRLLRRLGRGAMADVYLAEQGSLRRQVALKTLKRQLAEDQTYVRRFHMEAQAAAALVQANIVQIYEVGCIDGWHYIAQEFVDGQNLSQFTTRSGAPPLKLAVAVMRQVSAALCKAADRGIVHRDIKPENIMLAKSGEVKVADFGLARVAGDTGVNLTQIGVTMGTPLYMSPEQIEGRELDSRSDIYSLGCTAYHMLAGKPPFAGETPLSVAVQHLNSPPPPLAEARPGMPPRLAQLVERMMAKKPSDRFIDPPALLNELHAVMAEGASQGWAAKPDYTSLAEILQAADQRSAATTRLDELMKNSAITRARRISIGWAAAALLGCALAGVGIAALTRPASLLAGAQTSVPQFNDVWRQLYHAKM